MMPEKKIMTQHEELRDKYSNILRGKMFSDQTLQHLDNDLIELLFQELTKWFGTSPPSTKAVKGELTKIVEKKLDLENVEMGENDGR
jgi:hypothetical protein